MRLFPRRRTRMVTEEAIWSMIKIFGALLFSAVLVTSRNPTNKNKEVKNG